MGRIYVEALIRADPEDVWRRSQNPADHARWDGRFGEISYLPGTDPQRFRYATFGVSGVGITAGDRWQADGRRTSALRFSSPNPLSPIRSGAGYWRYVPTADGVRFLTGYDYVPGWGRGIDRFVRPLMGWLTAWSFDRLRLWLESGIPPERSRNRAAAEVFARCAAVAAAACAGVGVAVPVAVLALVVPPLPGTPAARRCLRRPPERVVPPALLDRLEAP